MFESPKIIFNYLCKQKQKKMIDKGRILPGKVLVKPIQESEKTESGLIYKPVDVVKQRTFVGKVVLVGDDLPTMKMVVAPGDSILHSPHSFAGVEIDGENYRLLNLQDILFIWREA